ERLAGHDSPLCRGCRCRGRARSEGRGESDDGSRRPVLGRPLRQARGSLRSPLVGSHAPARRYARGDEEGDGGDAERGGMNPAPGFKKYPGHSVTTQPSRAHVQVLYKGELIADTRDAVELHESQSSSHVLAPVVYYIPREDVKMDRLAATSHTT